MEKRNNVLLLLSSLPVFTIFLLWLLIPNRFLYAQTIFPRATPILSSTANRNQTQPLSRNEYLTLSIAAVAAIFAGVSAIGTILSGYASVRSLRKSDKETLSMFVGVYKELEAKAETETEKQRLAEKIFYFEQKLRDLDQSFDNSKQAEKWLLHGRNNQLVDEAVNYALDPSFPSKTREKFKSNIDDYLYLIQNCLDIGESSLIDDELKNIEQVLSKNFYEKALSEYVVAKKAANTNLPQDAIKIMRNYTEYLVRSLN